MEIQDPDDPSADNMSLRNIMERRLELIKGSTLIIPGQQEQEEEWVVQALKHVLHGVITF